MITLCAVCFAAGREASPVSGAFLFGTAVLVVTTLALLAWMVTLVVRTERIRHDVLR